MTRFYDFLLETLAVAIEVTAISGFIGMLILVIALLAYGP